MERYNTGFKVPVTGIIGAICGDIIGSAYEFHPIDDYNFEPFVKRTHVTDDRMEEGMSAAELAEAVSVYDGNKTIYFVYIDREGESTLFNIKDGGTDRYSEDLRIIQAGRLIEALGEYSPETILHFESGTINFTVNSIYEDSEGCVCLESNEIMELDDYLVGLLLEDLSHCSKGTGIYFYDDDSEEYYGIYPDEIRTDEKGDVWIKVR